jgi:hypothetical protein
MDLRSPAKCPGREVSSRYKGWEGVTMADVTKKALYRGKHKDKPSKYHNVKKVVEGQKFDSAKEADCYLNLLLRLRAGEIRGLACQVPFDLLAPDPHGGAVVVATYVADFVFEEQIAPDLWRKVVMDAKGHRTALYLLKRKWLELQTGIIITET